MVTCATKGLWLCQSQGGSVQATRGAGRGRPRGESATHLLVQLGTQVMVHVRPHRGGRRLGHLGEPAHARERGRQRRLLRASIPATFRDLARGRCSGLCGARLLCSGYHSGWLRRGRGGAAHCPRRRGGHARLLPNDTRGGRCDSWRGVAGPSTAASARRSTRSGAGHERGGVRAQLRCPVAVGRERAGEGAGDDDGDRGRVSCAPHREEAAPLLLLRLLPPLQDVRVGDPPLARLLRVLREVERLPLPEEPQLHGGGPLGLGMLALLAPPHDAGGGSVQRVGVANGGRAAPSALRRPRPAGRRRCFARLGGRRRGWRRSRGCGWPLVPHHVHAVAPRSTPRSERRTANLASRTRPGPGHVARRTATASGSGASRRTCLTPRHSAAPGQKRPKVELRGGFRTTWLAVGGAPLRTGPAGRPAGTTRAS